MCFVNYFSIIGLFVFLIYWFNFKSYFFFTIMSKKLYDALQLINFKISINESKNIRLVKTL